MRLGALLLALALGALGPAASAQDARPSPAPSPTARTSPGFLGSWRTVYGTLVLHAEGDVIRGTYGPGGTSTLTGSLRGRRLEFRYVEVGARGEGWFELDAKGDAFRGRWRPDGEEDWREWSGEREAPPAQLPFAGVFETRYGQLRLQQQGAQVTGLYRYGETWGRIEGKVAGGRLKFSWREASASGSGEFRREGLQLRGSWRGTGAAESKPWNGQLVPPRPDVRWLVVLEAYWEERLEEREYSFGAMLRAYFRRYPRVEVRQRRFSDRADFVRAAREVAFIPEPVVLLLASHGEEGQLVAGQERIPPELVGRLAADLPQLVLLHFSACEVFVGQVPARLRKDLPQGRQLPISGYEVAVDWSGSALLEQLYLDLILGRGYTPRRAAEVVARELRFAGREAAPSSPLGALRFRFQAE